MVMGLQQAPGPAALSSMGKVRDTAGCDSKLSREEV